MKKRRRWTKKTDVKDAKEPRKHLKKSKSPLTGKKKKNYITGTLYLFDCSFKFTSLWICGVLAALSLKVKVQII